MESKSKIESMDAVENYLCQLEALTEVALSSDSMYELPRCTLHHYFYAIQELVLVAKKCLTEK